MAVNGFLMVRKCVNLQIGWSVRDFKSANEENFQYNGGEDILWWTAFVP